MMNYFIKQNEIGLRYIEFNDENVFLHWHNDYETRETIGGIFPFTRNTFREICRSCNEPYPYNIWFAVCEDDKLIGIAGLHSVKYVQRNAELAILIGEKSDRHRGKGRIVIDLIEEYAFGTLALHRLYALVYAYNCPAMKFFEACDWNLEGIMQEAVYWNYHFCDVAMWAKLNSKNGLEAKIINNL